jgi:hypothetical protein
MLRRALVPAWDFEHSFTLPNGVEEDSDATQVVHIPG